MLRIILDGCNAVRRDQVNDHDPYRSVSFISLKVPVACLAKGKLLRDIILCLIS